MFGIEINPLLQTLFGGLLGGGLIGFIEFMIRRHDAKKDKNSEVLRAVADLSVKVDSIETRLDHEKADRIRRRILAFDDETRRELKHSQESFNQIIEDIDFYRRYCHEHPEYENNKAQSAMSNILAVYQRVKEHNDFI